MKISPRDKVQALKYSKQYADDYKRYVKDQGEEYYVLHGSPQALVANLSESAKELCRKYDLRYPIDPTEPFHEWEVEFAFPVISYLDDPEAWRDVKKNNLTDEHGKNIIQNINGKLVVMIDTSYSKEKIINALNDIVDMTLISSRKKNKGRIRKSSEVDIWKVYRMNRNEGINRLQIAKKLFGFTTNPTYDYMADARYQQVKRAIEKAHQIIQATEKAARSRINQ